MDGNPETINICNGIYYYYAVKATGPGNAFQVPPFYLALTAATCGGGSINFGGYSGGGAGPRGVFSASGLAAGVGTQTLSNQFTSDPGTNYPNIGWNGTCTIAYF